MKRLTARAKNGLAYLVNVKPDEQEVDSPHKNTLQCILDCFERLAQYEDAEEQGLLVRLPCKVGDTVYVITQVFNGNKAEWAIGSRKIDGISGNALNPVWVVSKQPYELHFFPSEFGKTVFLTREEAEAALKGGAE